MAKGPLAVRWGDWKLDEPHAGAVGRVRVELENAGTVRWRDSIRLAYHWLDDRGNPIVWDGIRTPLPELEPGGRATIDARVRGPIPPGRYRFALDVVAEYRAWFSELGSESPTLDVDVLPRNGTPRAERPTWIEVPAEAERRIADAHAEGYAVVAGAVEWIGGLGRRRPRALGPYEPGPGRVPNFPHALLCPSVLDGVELEPLGDVAGLPAFAAPAAETWLYDGRIVLRAHPKRRAS